MAERAAEQDDAAPGQRADLRLVSPVDEGGQGSFDGAAEAAPETTGSGGATTRAELSRSQRIWLKTRILLRRARLSAARRLRDPFSFSTLTARIVALNLVALGVLVGGVLFLSQFRAGLIDLRIDALKTEADLIAATVAEAAGDPTETAYDTIIANEVLRRLALPTGLRAQLYDRNARLTGDTQSLLGADAAIVPKPNSRDDPDGFLEHIEALYDRTVRMFKDPPERYRETPPAGVSKDAEVYAALSGSRASAERLNSNDELILSVAVPVQKAPVVMGALVVSTVGGDIDEIVKEERIAILQVFAVAFVVTLLVSIALAQTIARPIRELAKAAEDGGSRESGPLNPERIAIPDFTARSDEIGELSGALQRMCDALYSRIDAIESFAADVAHEIKNPLTSLRSAVETLGYAKTDDARAKLRAVIEHDIRRLDRLVTDISNASRLDAELVREQKRAFNLIELMRNIISVAEGQAAKREVRLRVALPREAVSLRGLEARLAQVFHNLIDNALSFSPAGATLLVEAAKDTLDGKPAARITVTDEGPGVPEDNLESIFERFYSERPETEGFGNHSGLGLSICRQIVDAHGGLIWAENRTNQTGARFTVVLPL